MNWYGIQTLRLFGLAKNIKLPRENSRVQKVAEASAPATEAPEMASAYD
jgi:hypothetical protein